MYNIKNLFIRALLALSLVGAAPAVLAAPIYQVSIAGNADAVALDLQFLGFPGLEPTYAHISNLQGDFGSFLLDNATGNLADGFTIGDDMGFNGILFELLSGSPISFNLRFSDADLATTTFSAALLDIGGNEIGGGKLITVNLQPDVPVEVVSGPGAVVVDLPEPSDWALLATGLLLMGATRRLRRGR
ncbi:MAG: hypothetical protein EOP92_09535 [Lysobacteraceae bacterium]|nr:MAG: hypothetical protein EOP92_09535 [Xanthomonadaceae bacterium]